MIRPYNYLIYLATTLILFYSCHTTIPETVEQALNNIPAHVDFNFDVKPILSDRCFTCHGPDVQKLKGDLRLDLPEIALGSLVSGNGRAIVPGDIHSSELVQRILSMDQDKVMPPPDSKLNLSPREKAILIKWIEQGAQYDKHWAFDKPKKEAIPSSTSGWPKNEIDYFIEKKLVDQNIDPAPEASKEELIRRLYFDITGLPPSTTDLDYWISYSEMDYYDSLVDSLLSNEGFGERIAAHWLDVARFADSEGYLDDFHHTFWPYRDWVINAFNTNLPYDEFIEHQVGGDQIPGASQDQILATAFNRNHKQNSEGGIIPEEFRVDYVADRTNTIGTAFLGLTVGCARCHDHKYDPFTQENYYQLFSFFNATIERGDGIFGLNAIENGQMVANNYSMNAGPVLSLLSPEEDSLRAYLLHEIGAQQIKLENTRRERQTAYIQWKNGQGDISALERAIDDATKTNLSFDDMANGTVSDLAKGAKKAVYYGKIEPVQGRKGRALKSNASGLFIGDGSRIQFEKSDPFTISFWIHTPKRFDEAHVLYNGNNRIQGYRGWDIMISEGRLHFRLNHAHPYQSFDIRTKDTLPINSWEHFVWTYDGSGSAEGMKLFQNGRGTEKVIERNYLVRSTLPYLNPAATVYMPYQGLLIGNRHYDQDFSDGLLDEIRILNKEADHTVATYLFDEKSGGATYEKLLHEEGDELLPFYSQFIDEEQEVIRQELGALQKREIQLMDDAQEIMVMGDYTQGRPTYILERGIYDAHGEEVKQEVPNSILPFPDNLPRNRYGLAQWLTHPDHPLTARVAVNQIWYLLFGTGIVETVEDFGNQGSLPTHPALLDWLAVDFQQNGWDLKRLIKQIVTTATYRQSSVIRPELAEVDPENKLLARGSRYRRSAEMIRDNILAASGLLNEKVGGISTFPYQPDGLWKEVMTHGFFPEYEIDYEHGLYRRSIYSFWKRNMPPPSMLIFDAASRTECQVRRQRSNSPIQALLLLNDPQMIEGCRVLAQKAWLSTGGQLENAIEKVFRQLTSRYPTDQERSILEKQFLDELAYFQNDPSRYNEYLAIGEAGVPASIARPQLAALGRVANTILNTTEAYYKN